MYKDPEKKREKDRRYRIANPEKCREATRRWKLANLEKQREVRHRWNIVNPDKVCEYSRRYREANPKKIRETNQRWRVANPNKIRENIQHRRLKDPEYYRLKDIGRDHGCLPELLLRVEFRDDYRCQHCGTEENSSFDHIVSVSKGGKTTFDNLQILCRPCNSRKGNR